MDRSMRTLPEEMTARELVEYCLRTLAANAKVGSIGISELRCLYSSWPSHDCRFLALGWLSGDLQCCDLHLVPFSD
jgi:hypothetical protein